MNRLREYFRDFRSRDRSLMVESFMIWHRNGDLDMDPVYQREYVWTQKEQDSFLVTLVRGFPVGVIAISDDIEFKETKWIEVIDGKQRLTTVFKFIDGEIGIPMPDGSRLYWDEMNKSEQLRFRGIPMPTIDLQECTAKDRLEFFYRTNFAGVPQSEDHKKKIMDMMK